MRFEDMDRRACIAARQRLKQAVILRCKDERGSPYWLTVREAARMLRVPQQDVELVAADTHVDSDGWIDLVGPLDATTGDMQLEWVAAH
jgi:hypothetical protein